MAIHRSSAPKKWWGFGTGIWVQAIAGNNYSFSHYYAALKTILNLNQVQLNNLSISKAVGTKDVGKAFGLRAGYASDYLPTWIILLISSIEGFVGYDVQWLVVSQRIRPLPYWQMCIFLCMGGNNTTWMNTGDMRNFSKNRGPAVGILKGYIGLICSALFASNPSAFLLIPMFVPGIVSLTSTFFLQLCPSAANEAEETEKAKNFTTLTILAIVSALYLQPSFSFCWQHL